MIVLLAGGLGCVEPPPQPATYGVRVVPDAAGWVVHWQGEGPVVVDAKRHDKGPVRLADDRPHIVQNVRIPPRITDRNAPVRFVVLGDGRASVDGVGPSAYWPGMLREALARKPAFVLNTGDLVKNGRARAEWTPYLQSLPVWPPIIAVRGNHDRGPWFDALNAGVPGGFDWRYGAVRVLGFDSEAADLDAGIQRLERQLQTDPHPWTIVVLHRPIYSRGNHGTDERGMNARLVPVLEKHGVDLVFSGHDHDYERFCPLLNGRCDPAGVTYVVTGGAATFTVPFPDLSRKVSADQKARDARHSRRFSGAHHFVEVQVRGDVAELTVHATRTGNLRPAGMLERFQVNRRQSR
jgi:predicted phosphodiesterase